MNRAICLLAAVTMLACGGPQKKHHDWDDDLPDAAASASAPAVAAAPPLDKACVGNDLNLDEVLSKPACLSSPADSSSNKLTTALSPELTALPPTVDPGGKVQLTLVFWNKGKTDLVMKFKVDPFPRFQVEAYDSSHKRADAPTSDPPPPPKGYEPPPEPEWKVATIAITAGGSARITVPWEAVKTVWAPEKLKKGMAAGGGFPRKPSGPLAKGVYAVKVVVPLTTVLDGFEPPSIDIGVGVEAPKKAAAKPGK